MKSIALKMLKISFIIFQFCAIAQTNDSRDCQGAVLINPESFYNVWLSQKDSDEEMQIRKTFNELSGPSEAMCVVNGDAYIELLRLNLQEVRLRYIKSNKPNISGKFELQSKQTGEMLSIDSQFMKFILKEEYYCYGLPVSSTNYHRCKYCGNTYMTTEFYYEGFNNGELTVPAISTTILLNARNCPNSQTGNCNDLLLEPLKECGDPVGCDGKITRYNSR